eukprot:6873834-Karenia_brevis.AAC.1
MVMTDDDDDDAQQNGHIMSDPCSGPVHMHRRPIGHPSPMHPHASGKLPGSFWDASGKKQLSTEKSSASTDYTHP